MLTKHGRTMHPPLSPTFERLLEYIKQSRGFDFTGYKRSSLMRRVQRRMQMVGVDNYETYQDYLEVYPNEFAQLFNMLLINVTSFFRDRPAWNFVAAEVIPRILERKALGEPIRIWSAGCASGEEACTLAIILAEALGIKQFKERVKIYATDLDEEALIYARQASYKGCTNLSAELLERYFESDETHYQFRKDLRCCVIFGRHDLIQDAPISRIDLLVCRNTLMYLNAETQGRVLSRFHFALQERGYLFLGKAEMLLTQTRLFVPVELRHRIFVKVPQTLSWESPRLLLQNYSESVEQTLGSARLRDLAHDSGPVAHVAVDINGLLILANQRARTLLGLDSRDLGRPLRDLKVSYRPVELRSLLDQVYTERSLLAQKDVAWAPLNGEVMYLDVQVVPLQDLGGNLLGASITFTDTTLAKQLKEDLLQSNQELELAYEELQSANEELETTNEELQSTNEELQSTNEELETMNEELQSTNEELHQRTEQIHQVNEFFEAVLASLRGGVAVVGQNLQVLAWNTQAESLWGLRVEEARGQHFFSLDCGLPVDQLRASLRACLSGEAALLTSVVQATNRWEQPISCKVTCTPLKGPMGSIQGAILVMEEPEEFPP
ncbi:CheR family methyltransferase [Anthocerotibacter panamensis]|uniref:CheR family methyltransferase n=1 Tax=Anthocerotibacter panamensis TaxID=2857077 RepID=UPI001C402524|nr:CheR family methyltransferase [Anthocerotibacter panamensis]